MFSIIEAAWVIITVLSAAPFKHSIHKGEELKTPNPTRKISTLTQGNAERDLGTNYNTTIIMLKAMCRYVGVTLNPYHKHASDPYDRAKELRRRDHDAHRKALKGGPFKLNMNPEAFFDRNPYRSDRPLPSGLRPDGGKKDVKPFKPSSPGKQVTHHD